MDSFSCNSDDISSLNQINSYQDLYKAADSDYLAFWSKQAEKLSWTKKWDEVLHFDLPFAQWFKEGMLNVCYNCVDRHVLQGRQDKIAFYFEGEREDSREITYGQLHQEVMQAANVLESLGVKPMDRVVIYMPMIPEAIVAMLATARIGAIHTVVFAGFSSESLLSRIEDAKASLVITADGGFRKGSILNLKSVVDCALNKLNQPIPTLVVRRTGEEITWNKDYDHAWQALLEAAPKMHEAKSFDSEHPLFILYTSGTTSKPKGILHSSGGYLTQVAYSHELVFDVNKDRDIYWCTADVGWITGHSYIVYGPLAGGVTQVLYEGAPDIPSKGRMFEIIEKYKVSILYTAPTLIRTWKKWGDEYPNSYDLSSLRVLGSVGEPINPEAWSWYSQVIGQGRCSVVDTWWQTETGSIMISPLPHDEYFKPGAATRALPGISVKVIDDHGKILNPSHSGYLVIDRPWPSMLRGIWQDEQRYKETYWSYFQDYYFAGDGARLDDDGDIWLLGRVDDVMNISGHRISTAEVESALVVHPSVAESAVIGASDEITGEAIIAFVILKQGIAFDKETLNQELKVHVGKEIGAIARPKKIVFVEELPKTRSGKIMRRLLRDLVEQRAIGDATTLADPKVMESIAASL